MRYSIITLFLCVYSSLGVYSIDFANFYHRGQTKYPSLIIVDTDFVWNVDKLMEKKQYYNGSLRAIAKYLYDSDGRLSQYKEYSYKDSTICRFFCTYAYDNEGHLVDETMEYTDSTAMMTDVITWSDKATNKCHMRYMWNKNDGNGKNATWRKSYFLTDRGKKLCTKRTVRKTAYFGEKCRMENMQPCSIFKKH